MNYNNSTSFRNNGNNNGGMLVLIILVMIVCVSMLCLSSIVGGVYAYESSKDSPSPSSDSSSPSPVNCELDWSEASWAPCTAENCPDDKIGHKYRTAVVKQAAKHGGRECPALTEYELLVSDAASDAASGADSDDAASDAASGAASDAASPIPID